MKYFIYTIIQNGTDVTMKLNFFSHPVKLFTILLKHFQR